MPLDRAVLTLLLAAALIGGCAADSAPPGTEDPEQDTAAGDATSSAADSDPDQDTPATAVASHDPLCTTLENLTAALDPVSWLDVATQYELLAQQLNDPDGTEIAIALAGEADTGHVTRLAAHARGLDTYAELLRAGIDPDRFSRLEVRQFDLPFSAIEEIDDRCELDMVTTWWIREIDHPLRNVAVQAEMYYVRGEPAASNYEGFTLAQTDVEVAASVDVQVVVHDDGQGYCIEARHRQLPDVSRVYGSAVGGPDFGTCDDLTSG